MNDKLFVRGFVILCAGLMVSSISSLLENFRIFGTATHFLQGLFAGLSVVAFGVAIFIFVRSK